MPLTGMMFALTSLLLTRPEQLEIVERLSEETSLVPADDGDLET